MTYYKSIRVIYGFARRSFSEGGVVLNKQISLLSMSETIDESVSVALLSNVVKGTVGPYALHWRGRRYMIRSVDLHHTMRDGKVLIHMFFVNDGVMHFKLQMNTETLGWRLLEVDSEHV